MNRIYVLRVLIALLVVVGCNKVDELNGSLTGGYVPSDGAICFNEDISTKGSITSSTTLDTMEVLAYYTASSEWAKATDITPFMTDQLVVKQSDSTWVYSPIKYWPSNEGEMITFYAFAPERAVNMTMDSVGKPEFTYVMSPLSNENHDLVVAVNYDQKQTDEGVSFGLEHALTRISVQANVENFEEAVYLNEGQDNVRFSINGLTFYNLNHTAQLSFDADGDIVWVVDERYSKINYTATQDLTFISVSDESSYLGTDFKDVCIDGKAMFLLPQTVDEATMQVRIHKEYDQINRVSLANKVEGTDYDEVLGSDGHIYYLEKAADGSYVYLSTNCEVVYSTADEIKIPSPDYDNNGTEDGWGQGEWINMKFTFDASINSVDIYDTPMTIVSEVREWTEVEVPVEVHNNIYMYTSNTSMEVESGEGHADFTVCTNYFYNLRTPYHREELDGAITSSRGFLFHSTAFTANGEEICYVPVMLDKNNNQIVPVTYDNDSSGDKDKYYFGSNNYEYEYDATDDFYYPLYWDPSTGEKVRFPYLDGQIDVTDYAFSSDSGLAGDIINYRVNVGADTPDDLQSAAISEDYYFTLSIRKSNRKDEGLYVSSAVGSNSSYGVNKEESDPVYILTLDIFPDNVTLFQGTLAGTVGVEMISNGGGMIETLYDVSVTVK